MLELQTNVEQLIKHHIAALTSNQQQKKSTHISHQDYTLICELYDYDDNGIVFINHFGHIEYKNRVFSKLFMLDKYEKLFNNLLNLSQLPLSITLEGDIFVMTYPNGLIAKLKLNHQVVNFQKTSLLQLRFTDVTDSFLIKKQTIDYKNRVSVFMNHIESPMFLVNSEGIIVDVPDCPVKVFTKDLRTTIGQSIFEVFPFDYAKEIMERIPKANEKLNPFFQYEYNHNKLIQLFDTTLYFTKNQMILCHLKDVSDLNTMSSTIEYLNTYDSLTGFYNTAYFEEQLVFLNEHGSHPLGVYVLTIQGLKHLNKVQGYQKSDNLIIEIALALKSVSSQHEIHCRISGDTFILFFPNCSKKTLEDFTIKMESHLTTYQSKYRSYLLTYVQKNIFIKTRQKNLSKVVKGLLS